MLDQTRSSPSSAPTPFREVQASRLLERLRQTYRSGRTRSLDWRKRQLKAIRAMVVEREPVFFDALRHDLGKCAFESFLGETGVLVADIDHVLKHLDDWVKPEKVSTPMALQPGKSYILREPLGVALVIAPWNYPLQLVLSPLVGAIAAGNCAVLKPSELAPATAAAVEEWVGKYLDDECVAVVQGAVPETQALLSQPFDHIFYTGSGGVGRIVMEAAAKHLTPVTLELGGKSPAIIDRDVDLDVAARRIVWGKFLNAGQTCVAPDHVLVDGEVEDALVERLRAAITDFYGQDPQQSPDYPRIINERHFDRLQELLAEGDVITGGETDREDRYIAPTLVRNAPEGGGLMSEEIFGPILPIVRVASVEEAIDRVNAGSKPLALYVFSKNKRIAQRVLEATSSGGACVNEVVAHLGAPELPFGGVGGSGMGAYHGKASFETFSHRKSVLDKGTLVDPALRYPPYDDAKLKWARRLL